MHIPVLLNEVVNILDIRKGQFVIDGTLGEGGHTLEIAKKIGKEGKMLVLDLEDEAIRAFKTKIAGKKDLPEIICENENFANIIETLKEKNFGQADRLLLDLGFSSNQIEERNKGFSFLRTEPLLMTYDANRKPVYEILREIREHDLEVIIRDLSDERYARKIAHAIKEAGKKERILTTTDLTNVIEKAVPKNYERGRINPATRTFMALRMYANDELGSLERILKNIGAILKPQGIVAIISFNSSEDRLVKNYFREMEKEKRAELLTKKPIEASEEEQEKNPRSRSAKLRALRVL